MLEATTTWNEPYQATCVRLEAEASRKDPAAQELFKLVHKTVLPCGHTFYYPATAIGVPEWIGRVVVMPYRCTVCGSYYLNRIKNLGNTYIRRYHPNSQKYDNPGGDVHSVHSEAVTKKEAIDAYANIPGAERDTISGAYYKVQTPGKAEAVFDTRDTPGWYRASSFPSESDAGYAYFPLLDDLKKHGRSVSVYRILEHGIPHVVAIHDSQPSRELESIISAHLAEGTPASLPDETVRAIFARREQNLVKASPTPDSKAWAYEQHHQVTNGASRKRDVPISHVSTRPLVERYITYERTQSDGKMDQAKIYHRQASIALAQTPYKYLWTPSAVAMAAYLMQPLELDSQPYMMSLPHDRHLWIEFQEGQTRPEGEIGGLFLVKTSDKATFVEAVKSYHPERRIFQQFLQDIQAETQVQTWMFTLVGMGGLPTWNMGIENKGKDATWLPAPWYTCPWGHCTTEQKSGGTLFHLCDGCRDVLAYWMSWMNTAWPMIRGDFQEREEVEEPEEWIIRTTRKVPRADKPNKFHEIDIEHRYRIIRFDASVRKVQPAREPVEHRGSWVELARAIDPDTVVYVDKRIGQTERRLQHERFTHKRGQVVKVREYERKQPMRLAELQKRLVKVVAQRFEEGS